MASAGLAAPVAESDRLTFSYRQAEQAWADIRDFPVRPHQSTGPMGGQGNGFLGHRTCRRVWAALESQRGEDGRIALGVELVLVHAWKPEPRQQTGSGRADPVQTVTWHPRRTG
jgi:malonyl-CoA O-methyltransferase